MWRGSTTACSRKTRPSPERDLGLVDAARWPRAGAAPPSRARLPCASRGRRRRRPDEHRERELGGRGRSSSTSVDGGVDSGPAPRRPRGGDRPRLVPGELENVRFRADECDPRPRTGPGELGVLGQETVSGVDGVRARGLGQVDDRVDVQVRADWVSAPPISYASSAFDLVTRGGPRGVDGNRGRPQLVCRPERTHGDLTAIRDEDLPGCHEAFTSRCSTPRYALRGRISALDSVCSTTCAVQPVTRDATKMA